MKLLKQYPGTFFTIGILMFIIPTAGRSYLTWPLPGTMEIELYDLTYWLNRIRHPTAVVGFVLLAYPLIILLRHGSWLRKAMLVMLTIVGGSLQYVGNVMFDPEVMFKKPEGLSYATAAESKLPPETVVIGYEREGEAKAYPVRFLAYHHQVEDEIEGKPFLVTYCSICRSGRVFDPILEGKHLRFGLIGVKHGNALLEDDNNGTWWHQATGEAVAGSWTGKQLNELFSEQMELGSWLEKYPNSDIMEPDEAAKAAYKGYEGFGTKLNELPTAGSKDEELPDFSLILGVESDGMSKVFPWNTLKEEQVVNDIVGMTPVLVGMEVNSASSHVWSRAVEGMELKFVLDSSGTGLQDVTTGSLWNWQGKCTAGKLSGKQLETIQSYQEYWHSWKSFHPNTQTYRN